VILLFFQEGFISQDVVDRIDDRDLQLDVLREMPATELSYAINLNTKIATVVKKFVSMIPQVDIEY